MLYDYLKSFEVKEGQYNFQSKEYRRKYFIQDDKFWVVYDKSTGDKYLMEHSILPYSCLRIDIDIKLSLTSLKPQGRLYSKEDIEFLITNINELLTNTENINSDDTLISVVFEKESFKEKDGFHIVYPNLLIYNSYQDDFIVKSLQKLTFNSPYEFTVDTVASKPWVLPGSKKDSSSLIYSISGVYDKALNPIPNPFETKDFSINKVAKGDIYGKPRNIVTKTIKPRYTTKEELANLFPHYREWQIDEAWDHQYQGGNPPIALIRGEAGQLEATLIVVKKRDPQKIELDYRLIVDHKLIDLLSDERVEEYNKWLDVGITLFNIGEGDERFFDLWVEFSKRSSKFDYNVCVRKWQTLQVKGRTIRTLLWWANKDNPILLEQETQNGINTFMYSTLFPEDEDFNDKEEDIKELLKRKIQHGDVSTMFKTKFNGVYTYYCDKNEKSGDWYKFYNGKWNKVARELLMRDIETLKPHIIKACREFLIDKAYINDIGKSFAKFRNNISESFANQPFIERTVKSCQTKLYDEEYGAKENKNKYLIGCNNGVLDFENEVFRESSPDDYISISTGITFKEYSEQSSEYIQLQSYFEEVFLDAEIREQAFDIFSTCLIGMNLNKIFVIAVGNKDSGKSSVMTLLMKTFGEYADKLDKSIITQHSRAVKSSEARPDLMATKGKRIIITQETGNEEINIGTVKELTGNDSLYARQLHKGSNGAITPMFTLFLQCNNLPKIDQNDEATWDRVVTLEFQSKFVDREHAPQTREKQLEMRIFPKDLDLEKRHLILAPCLLWFLFRRCIKKGFHKNIGLKFSDNIRNLKAQRRNDYDPVFLFLKDCIVTEASEDHVITVTEAFKRFEHWYPTFFLGQKMKLDRGIFKDRLSRHLGKVVKRSRMECWVNAHFSDDAL